MPTILKSRIAIVLILGVFLIPLATSSLRGLTHVLSCEQRVASPFTVIVQPDASAIVTSSATGAAGVSPALCGGLDVNLQAAAGNGGTLALTVVVKNVSSYPWQGTVDVALNRTVIPVPIGRVDAGEEVQQTVEMRLDPGVHDLTGNLLIGP